MKSLARSHGSHRLIAATVAWLALATVAQADRRPIVTSDLFHLRTANQIDVSADGRRAVYVVTSMFDEEGEAGYRRHLWLADLTGERAPRQLTFGTRSDGGPVFDPDGQRIAFVRTHDDASQVWILPLDGGEAFPLTSAEHGAYAPRWSPDGTRIVFGTEIPIAELEGAPPWPTERPGRSWRDTPEPAQDDEVGEVDDAQHASTIEPDPDGSIEEVRAWLADNAREGNPRVYARLDVQGERDLASDLAFSHLFVIEAEVEAEARQLTSGYQDFFDPTWHPDGRFVVATSVTFTEHPDRVDDSDLWRVSVSEGEDAAPPSPMLDWPGWSSFAPRFSADGRQLAFLASNQDDPAYALSELAVLPLAPDTEPRRLTNAPSHNVVSAPIWSADGQHVYATVTRHGSFPLIRVPLDGQPAVTLTEAGRGVRDFDLAGDRLVFGATSVTNPWELYTADAEGASERRLTSLHHEWLAERAIVEPTEHWLERPDGTRVQYWVMKPPAARSGQRVPMVLAIHGGPAAMWGPGEFTMWHEFQLLLSRGYGIVYANPRGSGGYGHAHRSANFQDWGHGPAGDILAALDEAAKLPWVDRDQLVVTGGSYAGYMTAWIVSQDHRFRAAVAQRGVYELSFFFGEGNAWRLVPYHFGGYPWEPEARAVLDANSPQTFVDRIRTPLLILHADQDLRTGVNQSEMLFKSLKVLGRPVEYVRYPDEGHDLSRSGNPRRRMDRLSRIVEFFARYVEHPTP